MAGYILALDQGTTSSRAIIYDDQANTVKIVQKPTQLITPKAGFVEQDAQQIWQTQISCAHDAINQAGLLATDITSIAITNQRESIVVWDKTTGKPLAPAHPRWRIYTRSPDPVAFRKSLFFNKLKRYCY